MGKAAWIVLPPVGFTEHSPLFFTAHCAAARFP
jgi:hypothetical protein